MRSLLITFYLVIVSLTIIKGQTNISGTVNTYAEIVNINLANNEVTLSSINGLITGDKVLIIQMQGTTIDQSQSASFGSITSYNECGNYEFQTICTVVGNTVTFNHKMINSYNANGAVQLIKVAQYSQATLVGGISSQPWNGVTGGVVVIQADTLNFATNTINVTGEGFRGGIAELSGQNCNFIGDLSFYTSKLDPDAKARKGEGITKPIIGKECGRGPQANGGGGGNNHNGGGSGGANYGAGGAGGQRIKKSTFLCGSEIGMNSLSLNQGYAIDKIFMGGGGGSGHGNNNGITGESGLNGGGIVILDVKTILSNNGSILANGVTSTVDANGDGAGGGGAGGSVFLNVDTVVGFLNIDVNGSAGINTNNGGASNCSGPGGGAGGGIIRTSGTSVLTSLNTSFAGGAAGIIATTSQTNCSVGSTNGGQPGGQGVVLSNLVIPVGNEIFASKVLNETACGSYLSPSGLYEWTISGTYFDTLYSGFCDTIVKVILTINNADTAVVVNNPVLTSVISGADYQWIDCEKNAAILGATAQSFTAITNGSYALQITHNGCIDTSACFQITNVGIIETGFGNSLLVYPNPTNGSVTIDVGQEFGEATFRVTSITGQMIQTWKGNLNTKQVFQIKGASGVYVLFISTDTGKNAVVKLIKQ